MKITINNNEIELKYSFRAMILFENVTGHTFTGGSITDAITFFYCITVSSAKDYTLSFDDFVDWLDDNNDRLNDFSDWLTSQIDNQNRLKKD